MFYIEYNYLPLTDTDFSEIHKIQAGYLRKISGIQIPFRRQRRNIDGQQTSVQAAQKRVVRRTIG